MKPFAALVVVEFAGSIAGGYAGRLFAGFGARVIIVEPPGGDPRRSEGPLVGGSGATFAYLHAGKESLGIDPGKAADGARLDAVLAAADVIIESASPGPLAPVTRGRPGLGQAIRAYISPFGLDGPYAGYRSTALTDFAAGGQMYLSGEAAREPLKGAGSQPEYAAGLHAFIGIMAALRAREATGNGQEVEVSHMEAMASLHQWTSVRWTHGGKIQRRVGNRFDTLHPVTIYPCKDGHVAISASSEDQSERFMAIAGIGEWHSDRRFNNGAARAENADSFDELVLPWLSERTCGEIVAICQEIRVPVAPVPALLELLEDAHLAARGFWRELPADGRTFKVPGPPFRLSGHGWEAKPAPALNASAELPPAGGACAASGARLADGPLTGVKILDVTRVWAGPLAARMLGDLGAEVIKVEATWGRARTVSEQVLRVSGRYPGNVAGERPWNRDGMANKFNRNKRGVTLNLDRPEGRETFEKLVRWADVVMENYSPRVMPQFGLGYERLKELNPAIVYLAMPGYGWDGPHRDWVAYGTTLEPHAGLSSMMGYRDSGPYKSGVAWADPVAAMHAAASICLALHGREADAERRGQSIELAQFEGMICLVGDEILAAQARGTNPERLGNCHPVWAPQGAYPCAGEDRWIAISITNEGEWAALARQAGLPEEVAGLTEPERRARHDEIDDLLTAFTRGEEHIALMRRLQAAGVPAVALFDARELVENEHLRARNFWIPITHPDCGTIDFPGLAIRLSATPATYRRPAPGLGEHNREILRGIAGLTDGEVGALYAAGVIADEPP